MTAELSVFPFLKPYGWSASTDVACRSLIEDLRSDAIPLVAFGYDKPTTIEYIRTSALPGLGLTLGQLEARAIENLRGRSPGWQTLDVKIGFFKKQRMLMAGGYLAPGMILIPEFMKSAHSQLKAELLAVGVPKKDMLIVTNGIQPPELIARFVAAVQSEYQGAGKDAISQGVFTMSAGEFVGMIQAPGSPEHAPPATPANAEDQAEVHVRGMVVTSKDTQLKYVVLTITGKDLNKAVNAMAQALVGTLQQGATQSDFSGRVHFILDPDLVPDSKARQEIIGRISQYLLNAIQELKLGLSSGRAVELTMEWGPEI